MNAEINGRICDEMTGQESKPPFSLTPALSRWEREERSPRQADAGSIRLPDALADFLPLPEGEGRGGHGA